MGLTLHKLISIKAVNLASHFSFEILKLPKS